jgi:hypothetical protein
LPAPHASLDFYRKFFAEGSTATNGNMAGYEPDFLHQNFMCMPTFLRDVAASAVWSKGMNDAGNWGR